MQYIVLGMHRSGTSMLARLLNMMGASVGDSRDLGRPAQDNEKGFWERWEVVRLNDRILLSAGGEWDDVHDVDLNRIRESDLADIVTRVREIVFTLDARRPWMLKDPRLSLTLPIWERSLESPVYLLASRNPLEVANSLHARNDFPLPVGLALWEHYNRQASTWLGAQGRSERSVVVDYESMLSDPIAGVGSLHEVLTKLGGTGLRLPSDAEVTAFVAAELNHHRGLEPANLVAIKFMEVLQPLYYRLSSRHLHRVPEWHEPLSDWSKETLRLKHLASLSDRERQRLRHELEAAEATSGRLEKQLASASERAEVQERSLTRLENECSQLRAKLEQAERARGDDTVAAIEELGSRLERWESVGHLIAARTESAVGECELRLTDRLSSEVSHAVRTLEQARQSKSDETLRQAMAWLSEMSRLHSAILRSRRWRLGNAICRLGEILTLRGRPRLASDDLVAIDSQVAAWKDALIAPTQGGQDLTAPASAEGDRTKRSSPWNPLRVLARVVGGAVSLIKQLVHGFISLLPISAARKEAFRQRIFEWQEAVLLRTPSADMLDEVRRLGELRFVPGVRQHHEASPIPLDLSLVLYRSEVHIPGFVQGLRELNYPLDQIRLLVTDHSPDGASACAFRDAVACLLPKLGHLEITSRTNGGFGCGHNHNLTRAGSEFFIVCNVDGRLAPDSLNALVKAIADSDSETVAWEFRQTPYEHPKYYDPVTLETTWVSGACTAFRTSALRDVDGFDTTFFMYGEDVDLSFRLRSRGGRLRYAPKAVMVHNTYAEAAEFKPLQFLGSTLANMYLRLRFGGGPELAAIIPMWLRLAPIAYRQGLFSAYLRNSLSLLRNAPHFLSSRAAQTRFPFSGWDYGLRRDGAFVTSPDLANVALPLVSIVVRTYGDRGALLRQALQTIANQTYPNIEAVVAEDGGSGARAVCEEVGSSTGLTIRHLDLPKLGRCHAGNAGMAAAKGEILGFLDDDDLFFADHIEQLVGALLRHPCIAAAYALAWESAVQPDEAGQPQEVMHRTVPAHRQSFSREVLAIHNLMPIQAVLFRRSLFETYGGFDPELEILEDWDLWRRYSWEHDFLLIEKTTSIYHVPADREANARRQVELDEYYQVAKSRFDRFCRARMAAQANGGGVGPQARSLQE